MGTTVYGFTCTDNPDAEQLKDFDEFAAKLDLVETGSGKKAIWLYEDEETASEARDLAFLLGLAPTKPNKYDAVASLK